MFFHPQLSTIKDVVNSFRPRTTGEIRIMLKQKLPLASPPQSIKVEYVKGLTSNEHVHLVPKETLRRFEKKAVLFEKLYDNA